MRKPPERRKPAVDETAGFLGTFRSGTAFDIPEHISPTRERQARRICNAFAVSFPLALTIATLAYDTGRAT